VIVDIHAHLFPAAYLDRLAGLGHADVDAVRGLGAGDSADDVARRFELMNRAGVDLQVVSPSSLVPWVGGALEAADAARAGNDLYAETVARHPGRLAAFAVLPLPHLDAALAEVDRALGLPGIVGLAVTTSVGGRSIADAVFEPLFAELDRRGAVLFVHPAGVDAGSTLIRDAGLSWMIGAPVEDTLAAVHLIARGVPARFPQMQIVIPHLGGALPMLLRRLDGQFPRLAPDAPELPSAAVRRMWFDTVAHGHAPALAVAAASFGVDRLVLGTDYPYARGEQYVDAISYVSGAGLADEAARTVLDAAGQLLGLGRARLEA
jgi:aminocarboxymuconate-semialdehyde decarboxylase